MFVQQLYKAFPHELLRLGIHEEDTTSLLSTRHNAESEQSLVIKEPKLAKGIASWVAFDSGSGYSAALVIYCLKLGSP
uniref:Uncharacterized protein n=1 Tax=Arion vulgaris TaxID=1028688 RepID=A0A0B6Z4Q6_9EUPU